MYPLRQKHSGLACTLQWSLHPHRTHLQGDRPFQTMTQVLLLAISLVWHHETQWIPEPVESQPLICSTMPVAIQLANPCGHSALQQNYPGMFLLGLLSNHVARSNCTREYLCLYQEEGSTLLMTQCGYILNCHFMYMVVIMVKQKL